MNEKCGQLIVLNTVEKPQLSNPNPDSYRDGPHYAI
jgi:hypothetical protein